MLYDPKWQVKADTADAALLRKARSLIEREEDWSPCGWGSPQRCGLHALTFAATGDGNGSCPDTEQFLHEAAGDHFGAYNDTHSHEEVLAAFDRAIELANNRS